MPQGKLLGASALAKELGISREMIYQYTRSGKLTVNDGKYDLDVARRELAENVGIKMGGVPRRSERTPEAATQAVKPATAVDAAPRRELKTVAVVDLQKLAIGERIRSSKIKNDLQEGKLLKAEEVKAAVSGMISRARSRLITIGDELGERLAAEQDPVRCRQIVDERITRALAELAQWAGSAEHPVAA